MSDVFFIPFDPASGTAGLSQATVRLLQTLLERSASELPADVPLKVHFGEKGNRTYLKPEVYDGIIDFIRAQGRTCHFVETSVLYGGERFSREKHLALAKKHGFSRIPAVIADGAHGEESVSVPVNLKHFQSASIAKALAEADRVVVLSHFKGHPMGGFGGALKQLSIGCASSEGKAWIHSAGQIKDQRTVWRNLPPQDRFLESMADAASSVVRYFDGRAAYINVMKNLSVDCDCCAIAEDPCMADIGVLASLDPVAIDQACIDLVYAAKDDPGQAHFLERVESRHGIHTIEAAAELGFGSRAYELVCVDEE